MAKRERLEVIHDILTTINKAKQIRPTKLLHKSNLSPQMFKQYIQELTKKKFITKEGNQFVFRKKKDAEITPRNNAIEIVSNVIPWRINSIVARIVEVAANVNTTMCLSAFFFVRCFVKEGLYPE